ncbi:MAG TPA: class I SAM-dependent methyltransferase [Candidatus Omnitrophota bacterium]|nr:class I SAM-dependent methyltransferase [Candidatus Omnitrophota bacterium]
MDDKKRKQEEIKHFSELKKNKNATWWGNTTVAGKERKKRRLELIRDFIKPAHGMRILEIGCGDGIDTAYWTNFSAKLFSMDMCYDLIAQAKKDIPHGSVSFLVSDAELLPFADKTFDAVIGNSILHHVNILPALREIKRVLTKNGTMAFCEPNMLNPHVFLERKIPWIGKRLGISPHETAFLRKKLKKQMERCGFHSVEIIPFDFLHPATPRSLIQPVKRIGLALEKCFLLKEITGSLYIKASA